MRQDPQQEPTDSEKLVALRWPHLKKSWLDEVNEAVGWLKTRFSGNAKMLVPLSGGQMQRPEWLIQAKRDPSTKKRERKS